MTDNRVLAAAFGVLLVAWVLAAWTSGFFTRVSLPASTLWIDFVVTLLVLIFTPAVMSKASWTAPGAVIVGVIKIITDVGGLTMLPMSMIYGPAIGLVLGLLFTYFSFRAYQKK